jgi:hypothetical protein
VRGRGQGAVLAVTNPALVSIPRDSTTPTTTNNTYFTTSVFIVDSATPSATTQTFRLVNVGNQALSLGENSDLGAVTMSGSDGIDFIVSRQPYDSNGNPVTLLQPGDEAFFDLTFNPNWKQPQRDNALNGAWQQPEESLRQAVVTVNTNTTPNEVFASPDEYSFAVGGIANDPKMVVISRGQNIYDREYSAQLPNNTVYRDVDVWGGRTDYSFTVRNAGEIHPLEMGTIAQPFFDNEEHIWSLPIERIVGNRIYPTGFGVPNVLQPNHWIPNNAQQAVQYLPALNVDSSALTRMRVGDRITINGVTANITRIFPDANDIMELPRNSIVPWNLPPPDMMGISSGPFSFPIYAHPASNFVTNLAINNWDPGWVNFFADYASVFPLGHGFELPVRGYIQVDTPLAGTGGGSFTITNIVAGTPNTYVVNANPNQVSHFTLTLASGRLARYYIQAAAPLGNGNWTITVPPALSGISPLFENPNVILGRLLGFGLPNFNPSNPTEIIDASSAGRYRQNPVIAADERLVILAPDPGINPNGNNNVIWVWSDNLNGPYYPVTVLANNVAVGPIDEDTSDPDADPEPTRNFYRVRLPQNLINDFGGDHQAITTWLNAATTNWRQVTPFTPNGFSGRTFAHVSKSDFSVVSPVPTVLNPGDEWEMVVRFQPRWSTGFDWSRNTVGSVPAQPFVNGPVPTFPDRDGLGSPWYWWRVHNPTVPWPWDQAHPAGLDLPLGWLSQPLDLVPANTSQAPFSYTEGASSMVPLFNGTQEPRGWIEHLVEINIPNTDIDTHGDWKTGQIPLGSVGPYPHPRNDLSTWPAAPLWPQGEYNDGVTPDYEFGLMGMGRNPQPIINQVGDPWKMGAPPYDSIHAPYIALNPVPVRRRAPAIWGFPATQVLQQVTQTLSITAGPNRWTGLGFYGGSYLATGRLLLDPDPGRTTTIQGSAPSDYMAVINLGNGNDVDNDPNNPLSPNRHGLYELISGETLSFDVTFSPTAVTDPNNLQSFPIREATLVIPTNDATEDPFRITLQGSGSAPAIPPAPPEGDG